MLEYGIPYMNSTLIYGIPGTGKTEFARYVAFKLGLPYAYLNFTYLIEAYMGKTAQNLQRVFDYCKGQKCVLMLDEIDCIGLERGHDTGADGELGRTTIALMQALDGFIDGQVVIAATNRCDRLDKALLRRFQRQVEFTTFLQKDREAMIQTFINSIDPAFLTDEILRYAEEPHTQAETVKYLIEKIVEAVS
jgi:ATP-dependent 26S proteasome regulatory subunit